MNLEANKALLSEAGTTQVLNFIEGEFRQSGSSKTCENIAPATGQLLGLVHQADKCGDLRASRPVPCCRCSDGGPGFWWTETG